MRCAAGHPLMLSDKGISATRAAIPMIIATGAVHSYLVRQQLGPFTSVNVQSGECLDTHYFCVLIGVGATTVNAYLAQETIMRIDMHGLFGDTSLFDCVQRYREAVDEGLLKIMSKMGISDVVELSRRPQVRGRRS